MEQQRLAEVSPDVVDDLPVPSWASWLQWRESNLWMLGHSKVSRYDSTLHRPDLSAGGKHEREHSRPQNRYHWQVSLLHFDAYENLLCQVTGSKEVTLFHPLQLPLLYPTEMTQFALLPDFGGHWKVVSQPGSVLCVWRCVAHAPVAKRHQLRPMFEDRERTKPQIAANFSPINITGADLAKYPLFANASALHVTLQAGTTMSSSVTTTNTHHHTAVSNHCVPHPTRNGLVCRRCALFVRHDESGACNVAGVVCSPHTLLLNVAVCVAVAVHKLPLQTGVLVAPSKVDCRPSDSPQHGHQLLV